MGSRAETYVKLKHNARLLISGRFQLFFGASLEVCQDAVLALGKGYINTGSSVMCVHSISIGNGVFIARNVYITDSDHHALLNQEQSQFNPSQTGAIGDHAGIGVGATILKGVTIGTGEVIAAGSVVTKDVPAGCLVSVVPSRARKEHVIL